MTDLTELTEDEFISKFTVRPNHLNSNASWSFGCEKGCLYETFGEEVEYVFQQDIQYVWTLIDGDEDDSVYLVSGRHIVNRIGYFVTVEPVDENDTIQVRIPETD